MTAYFLKCHLDLPAPKEPLQNLPGMLVELGAEQCASFEFALRIPYQYPTDGHRRQAGVIPDRGAGRQFYQTPALSIPVIYEEPLPLCAAVAQDLLQRRQAGSDEPRPAHGTFLARGCRPKQARIQSQPSDADDRSSTRGPLRQQLQGGECTIGHYDKRAVRQPALHLQDKLTRPVGEEFGFVSLLVPVAF